MKTTCTILNASGGEIIDCPILQDLLEGVKQIADFYELPLSDEMIKSVADKTTFQAMSSKSPEILGRFASVIFRKGILSLRSQDCCVKKLFLQRTHMSSSGDN